MIIEKKCWPDMFERILLGTKKFEVRLDDFKIEAGDTLELREWDPETEDYTGRFCQCKIGFVLKTKDLPYWTPEEVAEHGFQVLSISRVDAPYHLSFGPGGISLVEVSRVVEPDGHLRDADYVTCSDCGRSIVEAWKFCPHCGVTDRPEEKPMPVAWALVLVLLGFALGISVLWWLGFFGG